MPRAEDVVVIRNIYYMMAYAFRAMHIKEYARLGSEEFESGDDMLAAVLVLGMESQRKRGFERGYVEVSEDVAGVKGRIDVSGSMPHEMARLPRVRCEFDEYSEDTYKNRIMKTAASALLRSPSVADERKRALKRSLLFLRDVGSVDPRSIRWSNLSYHRNSGAYQLLMGVCYLVLKGLIPSPDGEVMKIADFVDAQELHALYEKFVLEYFKRHHPRLHARAKVIDSALSDGAPSFIPRLCTDITLSTEERTLIVDTKCYGRILHCHYGHEILPTSNYHQIFTYVVTEAYNSPEKQVEGMLLYALTEHDAVIEESWEQAGHRLHVRTLDLGVDFDGSSRRMGISSPSVLSQHRAYRSVHGASTSIPSLVGSGPRRTSIPFAVAALS